MSHAPRISRFVLCFFRMIARVSFRRRFRAVRMSGAERFAQAAGEPLIVYGNHCSWWDVMTQVVLSAAFLPERSHFAPIDARSLERYGILKKIGVFGIEIASPRGAAQMLRVGLEILASGGVLWLTPQGRFADVRERPLGLKGGMAALATRVPGGCTVVPLAMEYAFWDERLPECLGLVGEPIRVNGESADEVTALLEAALVTVMDELRAKVVARDAAGFEVVLEGNRGLASLTDEVKLQARAVLGRSARGEGATAAVVAKERG